MMKMEEALSKYREHFGTPYVFFIGFSKSDEDIIAEIKSCILSDTPQPEPEYRDDLIY